MKFIGIRLIGFKEDVAMISIDSIQLMRQNKHHTDVYLSGGHAITVLNTAQEILDAIKAKIAIAKCERME